ncbi:Kae1-like domain-containing protein [Fuchsiella alkaliacetigena]|uniref:Kae1-like domain-containing protein n=1 Tax=Fuchsiella alkaliacetigena TaxID=957042 RepID=UPI00200AA886|nr:O-sialoglycoprotein endopeptidase [Fuchsiella alkaliacetigena]MCK8825446.1 O-sialoglycoprotein endopeptidase [Fuchsiella alkaliacetigena]
MALILGIDTSNYTTSAAVMDTEGNLIVEQRSLLEVEEGQRGLRQSKAVFQHVERLPEVIEDLDEAGFIKQDLVKIVVSTSPTQASDSYLPVFRVGEGFAKSLAVLLGVPLQEVSHQEGHLQAGLWSAEGPQSKKFLAVHLSGGTTELLRVAKQETGFKVEKLGAAVDLHAGQFVDRVGVRLGFDFPAGPQLEQLAKQGESGAVIIPSSVDAYDISFAGPNSAAMRAIEAGKKPADIALAVQSCIAKALEKVLRKALQEENLEEVLLVGGVAANQYLRQRLRKKLEHPAVGAKLFFAEARFSTDNAVGVAALGLES